MSDHNEAGVSRRDLLKRAGLAGAALTIPVTAAIPASIEDQAKPAAPVRGAATRADRKPHRGGSRHARGDLRADHSDRCQRSGRARGARGALHRSRARRRAVGVAPGLHGRPRGIRRLLPILAARAVHRALGARSGFGADRRRNRRGHRVRRQLRRVLRDGAHAHAARHLRRSVLRRQRQFRRLGSDRLSRRAHERVGRRSTPWREADAESSIGLRQRDVHTRRRRAPGAANWQHRTESHGGRHGH